MNEGDEKRIMWWGSSYRDLLEFPPDARRESGHQLGRVQAGLDPEDWKPFDEVGAGTREIRIKEEGPDGKGTFRVMYVAKFDEGIHVLHCFRKTTHVTSKHDKHVASERYRQWLVGEEIGNEQG